MIKGAADRSEHDAPMALDEALARTGLWEQNLGLRPSPAVARRTATALAKEIVRLEEFIQRAKRESELIQYKGNSVVAVPYWFVKS